MKKPHEVPNRKEQTVVVILGNFWISNQCTHTLTFISNYRHISYYRHVGISFAIVSFLQIKNNRTYPGSSWSISMATGEPHQNPTHNETIVLRSPRSSLRKQLNCTILFKLSILPIIPGESTMRRKGLYPLSDLTFPSVVNVCSGALALLYDKQGSVHMSSQLSENNDQSLPPPQCFCAIVCECCTVKRKRVGSIRTHTCSPLRHWLSS